MLASTEEKYSAAMKAVRHLLGRVCHDPQVAYLLGYATTSYGLLCEAMAADTGLPLHEVEALYPPAPQVTVEAKVNAMMGNLALDATHEAVCGELSVSPLIAAEVIRFAERRGDPLPYPDRDTPTGRPDWDFLADLDRAWSDWTAGARARGRQIH